MRLSRAQNFSPQTTLPHRHRLCDPFTSFLHTFQPPPSVERSQQVCAEQGEREWELTKTEGWMKSGTWRKEIYLLKTRSALHLYRNAIRQLNHIRSLSADNSATPPPTVRPRLREKKRRSATTNLLCCTRSRGRTGTAITGHRILSPACLPIPPFEQHGTKVVYYLRLSKTIALILMSAP